MNARFIQTLPDDLDEKIRKLAKKKGITRNAFINMILEDYVETSDESEVIKEIKKRLENVENEIELLKKRDWNA